MTISNDKTLREIQLDFQAHFPFLKIEFYDASHTAGEGSPPFQQVGDYSKQLGEVRKTHQKGNLNIDGDLKVSSLEHGFYKQYGLNVQVFRRSGTAWIQTITTDHWTLSQQNTKAKQYSLALNAKNNSI